MSILKKSLFIGFILLPTSIAFAGSEKIESAVKSGTEGEEAPALQKVANASVFYMRKFGEKPYILMGRMHKTKRKKKAFNNTYSTPSGGSEGDEVAYQAAKREFIQETGSVFDSVEMEPLILKAQTIKNRDWERDPSVDPSKRTVIFLIAAEDTHPTNLRSYTPKDENDEIQSLAWIDIKSLFEEADKKANYSYTIEEEVFEGKTIAADQFGMVDVSWTQFSEALISKFRLIDKNLTSYGFIPGTPEFKEEAENQKNSRKVPLKAQTLEEEFVDVAPYVANSLVEPGNRAKIQKFIEESFPIKIEESLHIEDSLQIKDSL